MSTQVRGSDASVLVYDESVFGADPGVPAAKKVYFSSCGLKAEQNQIDDDTMSSGRGTRRSGRGNINVSGNLNVTMAPEHIGFWLKHLLGTPATTGAGPYEHVFVPGDLPPGFRVETDWTSAIASKVNAYKGLRINSGSLTLPQEGFAKLNMSLLGKSHAVITAPLDDTPTDPGHEGLVGFEAIIKHGGARVGGVTSMSVEVNNNLGSDVYCFPATGETAGERFSLAEDKVVISGTLETVFQDFTFIDLGIAGTETTFEVVYTRGTGDGTAGNETISFLIDHADVPLMTQTIETQAGLKASIPFKAFASGTDMGLVVTLNNAIAAADL